MLLWSVLKPLSLLTWTWVWTSVLFWWTIFHPIQLGSNKSVFSCNGIFKSNFVNQKSFSSRWYKQFWWRFWSERCSYGLGKGKEVSFAEAQWSSSVLWIKVFSVLWWSLTLFQLNVHWPCASEHQALTSPAPTSSPRSSPIHSSSYPFPFSS